MDELKSESHNVFNFEVHSLVQCTVLQANGTYNLCRITFPLFRI